MKPPYNNQQYIDSGSLATWIHAKVTQIRPL